MARGPAPVNDRVGGGFQRGYGAERPPKVIHPGCKNGSGMWLQYGAKKSGRDPLAQGEKPLKYWKRKADGGNIFPA